MTHPDTILVIEDDVVLASLLQKSLQAEGHPVLVTQTGQEGLKILRNTEVFLVLLDLRLPDIAGIEVLREIQRLEAPPEIVIITAVARVQSAMAAIEAGAAGYFRKPVDLARLRALVHKLREQQRVRREHAALTLRSDQERHRLEALYVVSRHLASVHDTAQVLSLIVHETARLLGTEAVALRLIEGDEFVLRAHTGPAAALTARSRVKASESVSGLILAAGEPVSIEDVAEDARHDSAHTRGLADRGFHGFLGAPLRAGGEIIGALNAYTTDRRNFSPDEISLLSALADQASVAIEAARLHEEAARRAQQRATLSELARVLTTVLDTRVLAREILIAVQVLIPGVAGRVWEATDDGAALQLVASLGLREPEGEVRTRSSLGEGMIGIAMLTREPVISRDVREDPRFLDPAWATTEGLVSCIVLPLMSGERVTGGLTIYTRSPHVFTDDEVGLLRSFADQAAVALANARLFQREQEQRRQLEAVRAATAEISRMLELTDLLRLVSQRSADLLGAASGMVALWEEADQVLVPAAWHGHGEWFGGVRWKLGEGVAGTVAQRRQGLTVNDYRTSPLAHPTIGPKTPITAVLAEPLLYRDRLLGVLSVGSHDGQRSFTDGDRHLLALFAAQAAIAIDNARLHAQVQRRNQELQALFAVTDTVSRSLDIASITQAALLTTIEVLHVDAGRLYIFDEKAQVLRLAAHHGLPAEVLKDVACYAPGQGIIGRIFQEGRPIAFADITADPKYQGVARSRLGTQLGFRSAAGLPILTQGRSVGVIYVFGRAVKEFSSDDLGMLSTIGGQVGIAIENARLYQQVQEEAGALERRVEERTEALQAAQLQVVQSEKLASVGTLAAGVAHELNQPLMVIRGYAQELLADPRITEEELRDDLRRIEAQTSRMTAIITHLRDFSRQSKGKRQEIDLNHVVAQAFTFVGQQLKLRNIAVVQALDSSLPPVWGDPFQIEQVLLNLVTNARDAIEGTGVGSGTLMVRTERVADDRVAMSVTDSGPGIPPEVQPRIFDPFFTTKEVGKGTGLGLSICHGIMEEHRGEIQVESPVADGRGARITLLLPRSLRGTSETPGAPLPEPTAARRDAPEESERREGA